MAELIPIANLRGPQGVKGDKGDTGIGWKGQDLAETANLNSFTTAGTYNMPTPPANWAEMNYPANVGGNLIVLERMLNRCTQVFIPNHVSSNLDGGIWTRNQTAYNNLFARGWKFIPSQRIDNTAGRAIYTWDPTANREQLVYGDTGWRTISPTSPEYPAFALEDVITFADNRWPTIRRLGNMVYIKVTYLKRQAAAQSMSRALPSGFTNSLETCFNGTSANLTLGRIWLGRGSNTLNYQGPVVTVGQEITIQGSFITDDPWPTTLPGVPA